MTRPAAFLTVLVAALVAPSALALAQATSDPDAEARVHFDVARAAFDEGRYEEALEAFERSYELSQRGELLFNMATCADRLRRDEDALRWFEDYLEAVPEAGNRMAVESRVETLREAIAERQARDQELAAAQRDAEDGGSIVGKWWFWTIVAAVVVGAGVGITLALTSSGTQDPVLGDVGPGGIVEALRW